MAKLDYNSINFRNKDIDRMAGKFGNGDPIKNLSEKPKAVVDSVMMSKGYTPSLEKNIYSMSKSKAERDKNKKAAAESNPSKGVAPSNTPKAKAAIALEEANKKAKPGPRK
jgi:hypothetical protein